MSPSSADGLAHGFKNVIVGLEERVRRLVKWDRLGGSFGMELKRPL